MITKSTVRKEYERAYGYVRLQLKADCVHEHDFYEDKLEECSRISAEAARQSLRSKYYFRVEVPKDFWFSVYRKHVSLKAYWRAAKLSDIWLSSFVTSPE